MLGADQPHPACRRCLKGNHRENTGRNPMQTYLPLNAPHREELFEAILRYVEEDLESGFQNSRHALE